jgi:hypothetical protein
MHISNFKSNCSISKLKYIWTMITGQHFVVLDITSSNGEEKFSFYEPLVTISKACFILSDLDPAISSANKRVPLVIKALRRERDESILMGTIGKKTGYDDENGEYVTFTTIGNSFFLVFSVRGKEITLHLMKGYPRGYKKPDQLRSPKRVRPRN